MGAWRRPSAALLALLVLALGLLHLAARRGARAIDAHLAIAPAGGASQLLAVRAVRAGALAARSAAAGAPPLAWNATGLAGGAEGATPQGWDVALVRIRALATSNLVAVRTNDELVASVRDSEGAGVLFERWALPLPSEARGCARGGGEGRQVFALLSRRTGRFVRARAPGDEREWALTADEPWPADARVRARSPALLAALPASALFEAHGSHVFSCAVGAYVNVRPRGALRTHSDDGPPFGRPAGPLPRGALAIEPIAHALAHVATPLPAAGYTFVSVDYHIATAQDSGATLRSLGMNFVDLSLSGACARVGTCARGLHVLTRENGFTLCPQPHALRRAFFARYRQSELVRHADAFICSHPAAMCELFLPFGRALVVVVTTNLELARENGERWRAWLSAIQRLDADPRCVLGANSVYDQQYVRYFTGVEPLLLPSLASYVEPVYAPSRPQVLLAPAHSAAAEQQLDGVRAHAPDVQFARLRDLYPSYDFADLAAHPAVVFVPYTKSVMTFFELYRMGVPLFFPSLNLLVRWEMEHHVMSERIYWSTAPSPVVRPVGPSPNTRTDEGAVRHWLALSDAYTWPHVQYFDSVEHLARMLQAATPARLRNISAHMRQHTRAHDAVVRAHWAGALGRVLNSQAPGTLAVPDDLDTELERRFGLELPRAEPSCARDSAPDQGVWA